MQPTHRARGLASAGATAVLLMGLAVGSASAAVPARPAGPQNVCFERETCWVTANNVIYRASPGGTPLGQVHRGQGFDTVEYRDGWFRGNLWGGRANVWIYADYLDSTRP